MEVLIVNEAKHPVPRRFIQDWVQSMVTLLLQKRVMKKSQSVKELTLVFLDRPAALEINHQFRSRDYATDVLSFESDDPESLGELILCPDVLKQQAKEHGLSYQHELGYMLLHGVLHLLGYDHETGEEDARQMFKIQDDIFEKLRQ